MSVICFLCAVPRVLRVFGIDLWESGIKDALWNLRENEKDMWEWANET